MLFIVQFENLYIRQCGTEHATNDDNNLVYYNAVQAQEYYSDIIMGVRVSHLTFFL